jgi:hypothetical protein
MSDNSDQANIVVYKHWSDYHWTNVGWTKVDWTNEGWTNVGSTNEGWTKVVSDIENINKSPSIFVTFVAINFAY